MACRESLSSTRWTRVGANFERVREQIVERLKANPIPMQLPIGAEEKFAGVVDLVGMRAVHWKEDNMGAEYYVEDIPAELLPEAKKWRELLLETAAEADEDLMEKYLSDGDLDAEEIRRGIRRRTIDNEVVPMLCGTAFKNKGVQALLDAVIHYLPSPADLPPVNGHNDKEEEVSRALKDG